MYGHAEASAEAAQRLRGQADFRHQHQRLASGRKAIGDRLQIDLGLAAAGDAIEQIGGKAGVRADGGGGGLLLVVELRASAGARRDGVGGHRHALGVAALGQTARGLAPLRQQRVQLFFAHRTGEQQGCEQGWAAACAQTGSAGAPGLGQLPGPGMGIGQRFATAQRAGQRACLGFAKRGVGIARQPVQRAGQLLDQQRGVVAPGQCRAQPSADVSCPISTTTPTSSRGPNGTRTRQPTRAVSVSGASAGGR